MQALVYTAPETIEYRRESEPSLRPGDSLVKVEAVGICGSDLHAYLGHDSRRVPPLILGHEVSGTVVEGDNKGQQVVVNPLITCGKCDDCLNGYTNLCRDRQLIGMNRPGAFAESFSMPASNLIAVYTRTDPAKLALAEPAAVSLHAVRIVERIAMRPLSEGAALVIGGGAVGLLCAIVLQDYGCKEITLCETNERRRKVIAATGVCRVVDPKTEDVKLGSFDAVFDAVGIHQTRRASINAIKPGGIIMHIGLEDSSGEMDVRTMTLSEITFIGSYTYTALDFRVTVDKIVKGDFGPLDWTDERPLAAGSEAFRELIQGQVASPKIVLRP